MNRILFASALTLVVTSLSAQNSVGPAITTATNYGVLAAADAQTTQDALANGQAITGGLQLLARATVGGVDASATTHVHREGPNNLGVGVRIAEAGRVSSDANSGVSQAGTSDSAPTATRPGFGTHALRIAYPVPAGNTGVVSVLWQGQSTANAGGGVAVDLDGDGTPEFTGRMDGTPTAQRFPVTAGRNGVVLWVATTGHAGVRGVGRESYAGEVAVFYHPTPATGRCTFTPFGRPCGVRLGGTSRPLATGGDLVTLAVDGPSRALGAMAFGTALHTPLPLPFGSCDLLVDPFGYANFLTDRNGQATISFRAPANWHFVVDFQAVTLHLTGGAPRVHSSNGLNLVCR